MSQNGNDSNNSNNSNSSNNNSSVSWGTKAKYIGTGVVIGVVVAPLFRKVLEKIQPKVDELFDQMTGKTERYAEQASDLLSRAKEHFRNSEDGHDHPRPNRQAVNGVPKETESHTQSNGASIHE